MSKIAEAVGMARPKSAYSIGDQEVATQTEVVPAESVPALDTAYEDGRIREGDGEIDSIIRNAKVAYMDMFEKSGDMEPRYQARYMEVAATLMRNAIDAVKQKQDIAHRGKKFKAENQHAMLPPATVNTTNVFTSRETLLEMMRGKQAGPLNSPTDEDGKE